MAGKKGTKRKERNGAEKNEGGKGRKLVDTLGAVLASTTLTST
jgi:hypothetical protein